ncbi:MAG: hypothetical protein HY280_08690 [Nitrospinae bacterium]|nr:hypothetical protein [Nitrospinota bacterium]
MEASVENRDVSGWGLASPISEKFLSASRKKILMLRLTHIGSLSFLGMMAVMVVKSPAYFGVIMNVAGRQLLLSQRTKICRHQIEAEKNALKQN